MLAAIAPSLISAIIVLVGTPLGLLVLFLVVQSKRSGPRARHGQPRNPGGAAAPAVRVGSPATTGLPPTLTSLDASVFQPVPPMQSSAAIPSISSISFAPSVPSIPGVPPSAMPPPVHQGRLRGAEAPMRVVVPPTFARPPAAATVSPPTAATADQSDQPITIKPAGAIPMPPMPPMPPSLAAQTPAPAQTPADVPPADVHEAPTAPQEPGSGWLSSSTVMMSEDLRREVGLYVTQPGAQVVRPAWLAPKRFGSLTEQRMELKSYNRIGRADPSSAPLEIDLTDLPGAEHASRHHGTIQFVGGDWLLSDPGSINGVFVRPPGEPTFSTRLSSPVALSDGTEIAFGNVVLVFLDS